MVGYGNNKGIVPISCEEIFRRIANDDGGNSYEARIGRWLVVRYRWLVVRYLPHWEVVTCCEVLVSAIEIYNEAVQDTLERALHCNYCKLWRHREGCKIVNTVNTCGMIFTISAKKGFLFKEF